MKRLLFVVVGLAIAGFAAALVAPQFIDADIYKAEIARRVAAATGRQVAIDGAAEFVLFPSPRIRASRVRSTDPPGADGGISIEAKHVELELGWRSLLGGPVEIAELRVVEPTIAITTKESDDWALPGGSRLSAIHVERTEIENGRLTWTDARSGTRYDVEQVHVRLASPPFGSGLRIAGSATTGGLPLQFDAVVGEAHENRPRPISLTLSARPDLARATLRATYDAAGGTGLRGEFQVEGASLSAAFAAAGFAPSREGLLAALEQPFTTSGQISWKDGTIGANDLKVQLGEVRASGAVNWTLSRTPVVDLALAVSWLDLDQLMRLDRPRPPTGRTGPAASGGAAVAPVAGDAPPRALGLPKNLDASVDVTVDALGFNGEIVRQLRLSATLSRGDLVVNQAAALLPGGTEISGFAQIMPAVEPPRVEGALTVQSDNLRRLLGWLGVDTRNVPADRLHRFDGRARVQGALARLEFTGLDLKFDSSRLVGGVTLVTGERPRLGIDLRLDQINIDGYLTKGTGPGDTPPATPSGAMLSRALFDAFDANLQLRAGTITVRGMPMRGVALDGTLRAGDLDVREFGIEDVLGAQIRASGKVGRLAHTPTAVLDLRMKAADATRLLHMADLTAPARPSLALSGRLETAGDEARLERLEVAVGDVRLSGRGRFSLASGPRIALELRGDEVALDELPALSGTAGTAAPRIDALIDAATLRFGRHQVEDARFELRVENGAPYAAKLTGRFGGGGLQLDAARDGAGGPLAGTLVLTDVDIAQALGPAGMKALTGRADLRARFAVPVRDPLAGLAGSVELKGHGGALLGLDLAAMRDLVDPAEPATDVVTLLNAGLNGGSTPYRSITATGRVEAGVLRTDNLRLVTDSGDATGSGKLDLGRGTIDFAIMLPVAANDDVPELRIALNGPVGAPHVTIDFAQLQSYLLRRQARAPAPAQGSPGQ